MYDWFSQKSGTEEIEISLPDSDKWSDPDIKVLRTQRDKPLDDMDRQCPAYKNQSTHWWDGSQIYGSSEARTTVLRGKSLNGKLTLDTKSGHFPCPVMRKEFPSRAIARTGAWGWN